MFTGSAQHASINFGQYMIYGYVPNAPTATCKPAPTEKGVATHQLLLETLPDEATATSLMGIVYTLSQYSTGEVFLGDYPYQRFTEPEVLSFIDKFQKRLSEITEEIKARNKDLDVPYIYMLPENIPNSITI